jgi:hypothetical protein
VKVPAVRVPGLRLLADCMPPPPRASRTTWQPACSPSRRPRDSGHFATVLSRWDAGPCAPAFLHQSIAAKSGSAA